MAILGHNGSGKTTLLRIISKLEKPTSGSVTYLKPIITTLVFQRNVCFNQSIFKNAEYSLILRREKKEVRIKKVEGALTQVGLIEVKQRNALKLSEGQKRLLGLARALVLEPDLLLLDEPISYLDPDNSKKVISVISEIAKEKTIILTDPNGSNAEKLSTRMIFLRQGKLTEGH